MSTDRDPAAAAAERILRGPPVVCFPAWLREFYAGGAEYEPTYDRLKRRVGHGIGLELLRPLDGTTVLVGSVTVSPFEGDGLVYVLKEGVFSGDLPVEWLFPCPICEVPAGEECNGTHPERLWSLK